MCPFEGVFTYLCQALGQIYLCQASVKKSLFTNLGYRVGQSHCPYVLTMLSPVKSLLTDSCDGQPVYCLWNGNIAACTLIPVNACGLAVYLVVFDVANHERFACGCCGNAHAACENALRQG